MKENGFTQKIARNRRYPSETIMNANYTDNLALLTNTPDQDESLLHSLEQAARSTNLYINSNKKSSYFKQEGDISTSNGKLLK